MKHSIILSVAVAALLGLSAPAHSSVDAAREEVRQAEAALANSEREYDDARREFNAAKAALGRLNKADEAYAGARKAFNNASRLGMQSDAQKAIATERLRAAREKLAILEEHERVTREREEAATRARDDAVTRAREDAARAHDAEMERAREEAARAQEEAVAKAPAEHAAKQAQAARLREEIAAGEKAMEDLKKSPDNREDIESLRVQAATNGRIKSFVDRYDALQLRMQDLQHEIDAKKAELGRLGL